MPIRDQHSSPRVISDTPVPPSNLSYEGLIWWLHLHDSPSVWGTIFGPRITREDAEGNRIEDPPLSMISAECLDYWCNRMRSSKHPVLRARFAHVVWDLSKIAQHRKPPIDAAQIAIDSYLEALVTNRYEYSLTAHQIVPRLLGLARSINDNARLMECYRRLTEHALATGDDQEIATRARTLLIEIMSQPKKDWPSDLLEKLADKLKAILFMLELGSNSQHKRRVLAVALAEYYCKSDRQDEAKRVLRFYGEAVYHEGSSAKAMLACAWLEELYETYIQFQMRQDAETVMLEITKRQKSIPNELHTFTTKHEIKTDELKVWLDDVVTDSLEESIEKIAMAFMPNVKNEREFIERSRKDRLLGLFTTTVVGHDGKKQSEIGPVEDDPDGQLMRHLAQSFGHTQLFIDYALGHLITKHELTTEKLFAQVTKSPVWYKDRLPILARGIDALLKGDAIVATHLLVPEIESTVRNLAHQIGVQVQKVHPYGGYVWKNLDDLLREPPIQGLFGDNLIFYLRALLTDQRGANIRNDVSHGITPAGGFTKLDACRLFHVILVFSLFREKATETVENSDTPPSH